MSVLLLPTSRDVVAAWLLRVGLAVASQMSVDDAKAKVEVMAFDLVVEFPVAVFSDKTRRRAMRRFKWFPSYAELAELLDLEAGRLRRAQKRLKVLAGVATPAREGSQAPSPDVTDDGKEAIDRHGAWLLAPKD
jgi:hypothetical protein